MPPPLFAIGPWLFVALPLMVALPVGMITLTRLVCGLLGNDSFRLRPAIRQSPAAKLVGKPPDDAL